MTHKTEITTAPVQTFCPVIDCAECNAGPCPFDRQYAERLAKAQAEYDEAVNNLRIAEDNLRAVIQHG